MGMYDTGRAPPEHGRPCYFCRVQATQWAGHVPHDDIPACAECVARARALRARNEERRTSFDGTPAPPITQRSTQPARVDPVVTSAYWRH